MSDENKPSPKEKAQDKTSETLSEEAAMEQEVLKQYSKTLTPEIKASVIEMFENLIQETPKHGDYCVQKIKDMTRDVSGVVKISDDKHGSFVVSFDEDAIKYFVEKVVGVEKKELDAVVLDGASEITNMIYGILKKRLAGTGIQWQMCVPEVHVGYFESERLKPDNQALVIPFSVEDKNFKVGITIKKAA